MKPIFSTLIITILFLFVGLPNSSAQLEFKKFQVAIEGHYLHKSDDFRSSAGYGLGVNMEHRFNEKISILIRTVFRLFDNDPEGMLEMCFGPKYKIPLSEKIYLAPFAGIGPSVIVGNDYAGEFVSAMGGVQVYFDINEKRSIFIGSAYNNAMTFHPGEFWFWEVFLGFEF